MTREGQSPRDGSERPAQGGDWWSLRALHVQAVWRGLVSCSRAEEGMLLLMSLWHVMAQLLTDDEKCCGCIWDIAKLKWPNSFWKHSRRGNWRSLRAVILGVFWGVHNHSQDCPESVCKHASAQLHLLAHLLPLFKFLVSMAAASRSQHCWGSNQCCSEFSLLLRMPSLILNSVKQSRATEWVIHVANH